MSAPVTGRRPLARLDASAEPATGALRPSHHHSQCGGHPVLPTWTPDRVGRQLRPSRKGRRRSGRPAPRALSGRGRRSSRPPCSYALLVLGDMRLALGGALIWSYGAVARRVVGDRPVPALLILATLGITVRTIVYLLKEQRLRLLRATDLAYDPDRADVRRVVCCRGPAVDRPVRQRLLPAEPPTSAFDPAPSTVQTALRSCGPSSTCSPRRRALALLLTGAGVSVRRHGRRLGVDRDVHRRGHDGRRLGHHSQA